MDVFTHALPGLLERTDLFVATQETPSNKEGLEQELSNLLQQLGGLQQSQFTIFIPSSATNLTPTLISVEDHPDSFDDQIEEHIFIAQQPKPFSQFYKFAQAPHAFGCTLVHLLCLMADCAILQLLHNASSTKHFPPNITPVNLIDVERRAFWHAGELCRCAHFYSQRSVTAGKFLYLLLRCAENFFESYGAMEEWKWCRDCADATRRRVERLSVKTPPTICPVGDLIEGLPKGFRLNRSRSQRILWLLHHCAPKITHSIKLYQRAANQTAPEELKKIHPLGKSPQIAIEAPNLQKPLVLAESGTIIEYLVEHFATHLRPKRWREGQERRLGGETEEWMRYGYYMHFAEGSLMGLLLTGLLVEQIRNAPVPFFVKPVTRLIAGRFDNEFLIENYAMYFGFLEGELESSPDGGEFLCGTELTAADVMMSFPVLVGRTLVDLTKYPRVLAYIDTMEKGSEYKASIDEIEAKTGEKYEVV
ncbi:hypothetical protein PRZ48_013474 [Zasmidium cellare]|uniref:GST N-terminal domain-containing protein n=1 Tax=Zasmidium cellare TaxID=395010 RepID=A0ABR0E150_ZASCE|nr:hypothetical protein PRZ48_013474 [Zasmidium cellare]